MLVYDETQLREPNLLVPGRKPTGLVKINKPGFLVYALFQKSFYEKPLMGDLEEIVIGTGYRNDCERIVDGFRLVASGDNFNGSVLGRPDATILADPNETGVKRVVFWGLHPAASAPNRAWSVVQDRQGVGGSIRSHIDLESDGTIDFRLCSGTMASFAGVDWMSSRSFWAIAYDNTTATLYRDGQNLGTETISIGSYTTTVGHVLIPNYFSSFSNNPALVYLGVIDDASHHTLARSLTLDPYQFLEAA